MLYSNNFGKENNYKVTLDFIVYFVQKYVTIWRYLLPPEWFCCICRLALGSLSPRHIFWEVKRYENERTSNNSTYWVLFELIWRDYFRYVAMKYGNQIFYEGGKNLQDLYHSLFCQLLLQTFKILTNELTKTKNLNI